MGYRSEVAIVIQTDNTKPEDVKGWHLFIAELKANPKCDIAMKEIESGQYLDNGGIDMKTCCLYVDFTETKWYDTNEDVRSYLAIMEIAKTWCNEDRQDTQLTPMSMAFLRVGEESTDIEEEFYGDLGCDLAYTSRPTIELDGVRFT
jgi:hypothetical protein|tara:strand:- start:146 stop:586 length:441 start_codon:yes stop_codon:yes gene_type:complete